MIRGNYLRLHPASGATGQYAVDQESFLGAPQSLLVDEFDNTMLDGNIGKLHHYLGV